MNIQCAIGLNIDHFIELTGHCGNDVSVIKEDAIVICLAKTVL